MNLNTLRIGMFSYMFVNFSGTYAWILMKKNLKYSNNVLVGPWWDYVLY